MTAPAARPFEKATALMKAMGKTPARAKDTPGFIVNRIARPFYNEGLRVLGDGNAAVETIDRIMKEAGNFRMGPFELTDLIGNDINFAATESLYRSFFEDPRFARARFSSAWSPAAISGARPDGVFIAMAKVVSQSSAKAGWPMNSSHWAGKRGSTSRSCTTPRRSHRPANSSSTPRTATMKKRAVLQRLDASLSASGIIVSSCLRFSTTLMASWVKKPERVVGFATFYPLNDRKLIELAPGLRTLDKSVEQTEQLFKNLGKETVRVKDTAGLTFPRILSLIINEAARSLEEGVAAAEEIDIAMRLGVNYPQGPLRWADQIGLDEVLAVLEGLRRETGDDRYRPAPLLKKLVTAGYLGEISGRGFYSHNEGQVKS